MPIIAIDGPAAAGKGSLARKLSSWLDLPCMDTGLLYRMVGYDLLAAGHTIEDHEAATAIALSLDINGRDEFQLRGADMGEAASVVSSYPGVRQALLDLQRNFATQPGGAILDGRDIGTVICPDADIKFFITAEPEVRALRRYTELRNSGEFVHLEHVLADIKKRDARDSGRPNAPLAMAPDAIKIDTSDMSTDSVFAKGQAIVSEALGLKNPIP